MEKASTRGAVAGGELDGCRATGRGRHDERGGGGLATGAGRERKADIERKQGGRKETVV
jgi:hypothetical protein